MFSAADGISVPPLLSRADTLLTLFLRRLDFDTILDSFEPLAVYFDCSQLGKL